jgi:hypothetical protein
MAATKEFTMSFYPHPTQTAEVVNFGATSVQSAVIGPAATVSIGGQMVEVIIYATQDVYCTAGANPVATSANSKVIAAGNSARTEIAPGDRFAFLAVGTPGLVQIAEA